jgi:hypothetical protein
MRTLSAILVSAAMMVPALSHALAPRRALSSATLRTKVEQALGERTFVRLGRASKGSALRPFTLGVAGGPYAPHGTVNKFTGEVQITPINAAAR